ncbi:hypothetical protein LA080_010543 [Diaporthe eres]|nr:hypothetical protein LA080_010543 [Diaporthe eres]
MAYNSPTIQNGHLHRAHRRSAYFNVQLYRVSELIQHPSRITFREFCFLIWLVYALLRGFCCARSTLVLVGYVDLQRELLRQLCAEQNWLRMKFETHTKIFQQ